MMKQENKIIKELRKLYIKKCEVANINQDLSIKLDKKIEEFLEREIDSFELEFAVDTLNEGYGNLSFEDFIKQLKEQKKEKTKR